MSWSLAVIQNKNYTVVRELSPSEESLIQNSNDILTRFADEQQLYHMAYAAYEEYISVYQNCMENYGLSPELQPMIKENIITNLNTKIINFLTSVRTFLDHTEANLKKNNGETSEKYKCFKEITSKLFDQNLSYRFIYKFRNYVQHCGMPGIKMSMSSRLADETSGQILRTVKIKLDRDELLQKYDSWGSIVKRDLQNMPEEIDITTHISNMIQYIERINSYLIDADLKELNQAADSIITISSEAKPNIGVPVLAKIEQLPNKDITISIKNMRIDIANMIIASRTPI